LSYLVDTDWVVDFLAGRTTARRLFAALMSEGVAISIVTYGEIYEGILYGRDSNQQEEKFREFLGGVELVLLSPQIMERFGRIRGQLRRDGNLVGDMDLLIASTAIAHDLTLVTRNRRHFERVPGLELYQDS
jgi:tRNA(fMet)-specific endonuclease VapC